MGFIIGLNSCAVPPPQLKAAHLPNIRDKVKSIIKQLELADLQTISINGNIRKSSEFSREEILGLLAGEKIFRVQDSLKLLKKEGQKALINEVSNFKETRISSFKYYNYETKFCNENITLQIWRLKEGISKEIIEYKEYYWVKREKKINYHQSYQVITKKNSPKKLEIFNTDTEESLSIKIDGKKVQILPKGFTSLESYDPSIFEDMRMIFFRDIEGCN